jgi:hypothetical protein
MVNGTSVGETNRALGVKNRLQMAYGLNLSTKAGRFTIGSNFGHFSGLKWVPVVGCGGRLGRKVPFGSTALIAV